MSLLALIPSQAFFPIVPRFSMTNFYVFYWSRLGKLSNTSFVSGFLKVWVRLIEHG